jgi:transposase
MIRYIGLDVHKETIEVCVLHGTGKVLARHKVPCQREAIQDFAQQQLTHEDKVVLEATTNTWAVVQLVQPFVQQVVVGNPLKIKAIAEAKIKTDKIDAEVLAQLLRCDYLPTVWHPDAATQQLRQLTAHRSTLIRDRSRIKNRVQSVLAQLLIEPPVTVLFTKTGIEWLRQVALPADDRLIINSELKILDQVEAELLVIDQRLSELAYPHEQVRLLMTLPGIGFAVAQALIAALGDPSRFRDGDHAASYLGLTPSTYQSARHCYHGHITKAGNSQARWMLTQAAQQAAHHPGPVGVFFRRLLRRKTRNVAIVATARKLVTIAFLMLKNNEPYRYAVPSTTEDKLQELRCQATGQRQKPRGPIKPKVRRPPGVRARITPPLQQVYALQGLPPAKLPSELADGEKKALKEKGVFRWTQTIQKPQEKLWVERHQAAKNSSEAPKTSSETAAKIRHDQNLIFSSQVPKSSK